MKKLLIVGAGGHGKCCLDIARDMKFFDEIAFLDDNNIGECINDAKIIGSTQEMSKFVHEYQSIFVGIGNNIVRKQVFDQAKQLGYEIVNLISPKSTISSYASLKNGIVLFPNAVIEPNAIIGEGCIVCANTTINHDAVVNDYVLIYSNCVIRPNTNIGSYSRIGSSCTISFGTTLQEKSDIKDGLVINS